MRDLHPLKLFMDVTSPPAVHADVTTLILFSVRIKLCLKAIGP